MLFLLLSIIVVATSPIGKAIADRLAGRTPVHDPDEVRWWELRIEDRIAELEDRLDYAERLLRGDEPSRRGLNDPPAGTG